MTTRTATRMHLFLGLAGLLLLQFYVRPRLLEGRYSPDFIIIGLVVLALRGGPGLGAVAGFLVGLANDALAPARFGASALAHTIVGYLAAQTRAFFFADNLAVNAGFLAGAVWLRDLVVLLVSGTSREGMVGSLLVDSPLRALTTALAGVVLLAISRGWFGVRLEQP